MDIRKIILVAYLAGIMTHAAILDDLIEKISSYQVDKSYKKYSKRHYKRRHVVTDEEKWQYALKYLGYYTGTIDGDLLTPESYIAIESFQKKYQILASGFLEEYYKPYLSDIYTQLKLKQYLDDNATSRLTKHKKLQAALYVLGYYQGKIDGHIGKKSKNAIRNYLDTIGENGEKQNIKLKEEEREELVNKAKSTSKQLLEEMKEEYYFPLHYKQQEDTDDNITGFL